MYQKGNFLIPVAIIVAGLIVAGTFFFTRSDNNNGDTRDNDIQEEEKVDIKAVDSDDHILGNPNADIVIVEYSDLECPFCKDFHETMHQVIDEFGKEGRVAWVFRHFPLTQIHPKAFKEAEATECAWDQGGNDAFWAYTDRLFEITPSNNGLDLDMLPVIAEEVNLDVDEFNECLNDEKFSDKVRDSFNEAITAGGTGTPYNVFLIKGEDPIPVNGGLPFEQMKSLIEQTLLTL